jgi:glycosyltransferase involved in cell wall biosynthesis
MHDREKKICLIIPCYNEEKRLRMDQFADYGGDGIFLFVNDGSTDQTVNIISRYVGDNIFLLNLEDNVGKAEAVRSGMLHAQENAPFKQSEWIGFWDADLATPLSELVGFVNFAGIYNGEISAIWGSRICRLGSLIDRSGIRHILGRLFATVVTALLGIKSYDSQCGAKLFRREVIGIAFSERFISRWIFDLELILRLQGHTIVEYPLQSWSDISGSKLHIIRNAVGILIELIKIRIRYNK